MKRLLLSAILLVCFITAGLLGGSLPGVGTGQWTPASDMSDARDGAASVLLPTGDILISGGSNSAGSLQSADIYHTDGTLTVAAPMQSARAGHSATVLQDGRVLVVGGDTGGGSATSAAEIYDPVANAWTSAGPLANARIGHSATLLNDGRVAIVGGQAGGAPVTDIEIYDPSSNGFSVAASLTNPRTSHAAVKLADGRVLVAGGFGADANGNPIALNSVEIFDPVAGSVNAAAAMNVARGNHGATTVLDGLVVVTGGSDGTNDLASIETYNATTNTWTLSAATLSVPRSGHQATLLPANNSVLVSGGSSAGSPVLNADDYQPWTDTVVSGGAMNAQRVSGSGSALGVEGLYLAAGGSGGKSTELHRFPTIKTDKSDYSPGTQVLMTGTGYAAGENVDLNLKQDDGDPNTDTIVQADASGSISYQGFAPDNGDVGTHFHLTATGQTSGFQAQTTFTDANVKVFSAPSGTSFTLSFQTFNNTKNCTGAPTNSSTQGILPNQQGNNGNVGVGNPDSVELQAPAVSDQGTAFQNWSWTGLAASEQVSAVGNTTALATPTLTNPICVEANSGSVNAGTFTATYGTAVPAPTLTTISPSSADLNQALTNVVLTGSNFANDATVAVGGTGITLGTVTVNSSTQITISTVTINGSATTLGGHSITVTNPVPTGFSGGGSSSQTFTVNKRTTTTSVSCTPSTVSVNSLTSCTATVTDADNGTAITPTGSVSFASTGTGTFSAGGSCTLSGSPATCSVNYTPTAVGTGTHGISETYGSDATHSGSTSPNFNVTVTSAATTTTVTLTPSTVAVGQTSSVSVTVASVGGGPTPAGTISLASSDGTDVFGATTCTLASGACSVNVTPHEVGANPHKITATYTPTDSHTGSNGSANLTVTTASTSTTVSSSANPSVFGQSVTFTATVTDSSAGSTAQPTGSVQFVVDGVNFGSSVALTGASSTSSTASSGATATLTVNGSPHSVAANYVNADGNFSNSTGSLTGGQIVNKASTTTTVNSSQNPSTFGQSVTFTATVTDSSAGSTAQPTGSVQFVVDGVSFGSPVALTGASSTSSTAGGGATATLSVSGSPHSVAANYVNADGNFSNSSGSLAGGQIVNKASTSTAVGSSANPSVFGQSVTFTATVNDNSPGSTAQPTGSVQFVVDGVNLGSPVPLTGASSTSSTAGSGATATLSVSGSPHSVTANYLNADGNFLNSNGMLNGGQTITAAATSTMVSSSSNPSLFGQPVTFTATVADISPGSTAAPAGAVQFVVDGVNFGSPVALTGASSTSSTASSGATATLTVNGSPHSVKANYVNADGNFTNSSGMLTGGQTVNPAVTSTSVSSSLNPSIFGQSVTFTATVTDISPGSTAAPTGAVQFLVDGVNFGSPVLLTGASATSSTAASGATATLSVNSSPHSVTANYLNADGNFSNGSGSLAGGQAVKPAATSTAVSSSLNPSTFGQAVSFTAAVTNASGTGVTPSGTVQFVIDGAPLGAPVPLTGAGTATSASITTLNVSGSPHSVVANYINNDGNFTPSTGALSGGETVNPAATSTSVISSQNPSIFGQAVTFTATVSNASGTGVIPTGSVQFVVDGMNLGTPVPLNGAAIAVSNPTATLPVSGSPHSVVANYINFDPNFNPSSGSLSGGQVVTPAATSTAVASSLNPSLFGQAVNFVATVSNASGTGVTPTGTVQFVVDGVNFGGPVALTGGTATSGSITTLNVSGSPHSVVASFTSNNGNFSASSGSLAQVVNPAPTSVTIASSNLTSDFFNEPLTFTANVSSFATVNEGTMTVFDGPNPVCVTGIVSLGVAVCSSQALTVGTHNITAVYNPGPDFVGSSAPAIAQVVQARPTTTTVTLTTPIEVFQTDSITITVTDSLRDGFAVTPTGSVSLISTESSDDFNPASATCTLAAVSTGVASCQVTLTPIEPDARTITATYAPDAVHVGSSGSGDLMVTAAITSQKVCISSPFNGQSIAAGNTIWFSSVFQTRGPKITTLTHISFFNQTIQIGNSAPINVPDAEVVFDPNATSASTTYDGASTQWQTTLPTFNLAGKMFLTGFGYAVPAPIPGGTNPVTWCGFFASDSSSIDIGWQWGAAVYTSFSANNNVLGVKPVDDNKASVYQNSDQAGTPENYKPYVIGGARGGGGNNFTGGSSGSAAPL